MDGVASLGRVGALPRFFESDGVRKPRVAQDETDAVNGIPSAALDLIQSALVSDFLVGGGLDLRA